MDYSKMKREGKRGTQPDDMQREGGLTRALMTGGGKTMKEMVRNCNIRESLAKSPVDTPEKLDQTTKPYDGSMGNSVLVY